MVCFWRANVAQQGEHVVPNGSTLHSYMLGGSSRFKSLHKNLREGLVVGEQSDLMKHAMYIATDGHGMLLEPQQHSQKGRTQSWSREQEPV